MKIFNRFLPLHSLLLNLNWLNWHIMGLNIYLTNSFWCFFIGVFFWVDQGQPGSTHLTRNPITWPGQWPGRVSKLWSKRLVNKKKAAYCAWSHSQSRAKRWKMKSRKMLLLGNSTMIHCSLNSVSCIHCSLNSGACEQCNNSFFFSVC